MRPVQFLPRSITDLRDIHRFETRNSLTWAELLVGRLVDRAVSLRDFAERGSPLPEFGTGVRVVSESAFLIFYRVTTEAVVVLRVLHSARRITPRMLRKS